MQFFKDTKIDFMGKRYIWITLSVIMILFSLGSFFIRGLNMGIEFTGGTEVQVKFIKAKPVQEIRDELGRVGLGNAQIQQIGDPANNEVMIRMPLVKEKGESADLILNALREESQKQKVKEGRIDLNIADVSMIQAILLNVPGATESQAGDIARAVVGHRDQHMGIIKDYAEIQSLPELTPEYAQFLNGKSFLGDFSVRSINFIGPVVAPELRNKALLAIAGSLVGMLIYIWIRFQFQWGLAAVVALFHDVLITLGLFSLFGKEFSLPVVASFLTLVGYSVNDTIVVFDRIRENLRLKVGMGFDKIINLSINQTLSRTVITSLLTWMVVVFLFVFGGEVINPFAFVLFAGIIVGTYSSIYIASPILIIWREIFQKKK